MVNYYDVLLAKNLAGGGGGGGGGGTAMYRHDIWLTDFNLGRFNFNLVTSDATPYTTIGEVASALYANGISRSFSIPCIGFYHSSGTTRLVCGLRSDDGTKLNYVGVTTTAMSPSGYASGDISMTPTRFYDAVTALQ